MGISSGVLPLIAYNFASGNRERMHKAVRFALTRRIACAVICFALCESFAPFIVRFFVDDASSVQYGAEFVRLRTLALPFITVEFMLIAVFQGIGGAKQALFLSLFRKGILDLPLMVLFNVIWPMYGLMLVQPIMECCGAVIALIMYEGFVTREEIFVTTKMWTSDYDNGEATINASLERLGLDYIDLMILHHCMPKTPR